VITGYRVDPEGTREGQTKAGLPAADDHGVAEGPQRDVNHACREHDEGEEKLAVENNYSTSKGLFCRSNPFKVLKTAREASVPEIRNPSPAAPPRSYLGEGASVNDAFPSGRGHLVEHRFPSQYMSTGISWVPPVYMSNGRTKIDTVADASFTPRGPGSAP
jgi:hypothetical protein